VSTSNYADRNVLSVLLPAIKAEFHASDTMLGLLTGLAFALLYATLGLPVARLADRGNRKWIVTLSLIVWSVMTALSGVVGSFWQLALARFGVGAGEAGAIPPAQSLIADYFPPERRGRALAIFLSSATVGYLVGLVGASQLAVAYGWRAAFIVLGAPGLIIAVLTATVLHEPRRKAAYAIIASEAPPMGRVLRDLMRKPAFVNLLLAMTAYFFYAYGAAVFFPSYMVRVLHIDMRTVGAAFGLLSAGATIVGTLAGGFFTDILARRDRRWLVWLPALGLAISLPIAEFSLQIGSFKDYLGLSFVSGIVVGGTLPSMWTAIHLVCGTQRRAVSVALIFLFANLFGLGLGPVLTGVLSDLFTKQMGVVGLRYALMISTLALVPTVYFLIRSGRTLVADSED
jgi:MFS family permease